MNGTIAACLKVLNGERAHEALHRCAIDAVVAHQTKMLRHHARVLRREYFDWRAIGTGQARFAQIRISDVLVEGQHIDR